MVAAMLAGVAGTMAVGDIVANEWLAPGALHHKRIGMPDIDQIRTGLPNTGACWCAPTSVYNLLAYMANHGYPGVVPGPGNYQSQNNWGIVTVHLSLLGNAADVCPGGQDPSAEGCDNFDGSPPTSCSGGSEVDGCVRFKCGTSLQKVYESILGFGWLGSEADKLVWTARFLDPNETVPDFTMLAQLGLDGGIVTLCYGRYDADGVVAPNCPPASSTWRRTGGHCVTMNEAYAFGSDRWLGVRDPNQTNGLDSVQSPFVTRIHDVQNVGLKIAGGPCEHPGGCAVVMTELLSSAWTDCKRKRLLDGYLSVRPKTGSFHTFGSFGSLLLGPPLGGSGLGGGCPTGPLPLLDFVLDENLIGWYAIVAAPPGTPGPGTLTHFNPFASPAAGHDTPLASTSATRLVRARRGGIYALDGATGVIERFALTGERLDVFTVPGARAIGYDDATDAFIAIRPPSATAGSNYFIKIDGIDGESTETNDCISGLPTFDDWSSPSLAVCPNSGMSWLASATTVFGLASSREGPCGVVVVESIGGFESLTSIDFDDTGRLFAVDGGAVRSFERGPKGWAEVIDPRFDGVDVGSTFRMTRSRTNFDPLLHAEWLDNIEADDIEPDPDGIPDCFGDLNGDGVVNAADLGLMLGSWNGVGLADLNGDGVIDAADLGLLLGAWGECSR